MPSPFPGMNPYLERASVWESFRVDLVVGVHYQLSAQLPPKYVARIGNRVYTHEQTEEDRQRGDAIYNEKVPNLTIHDGDDLVTVIELLSPINRYTGSHRERYLYERNELLRAGSGLVEINLLRDELGAPAKPFTFDYCALVIGSERAQGELFWWLLRHPIPLLPIPLRATDTDARLDLKSVLDQVYDGGRYGNYIYLGPPEPRLSPDDAAWAATFIPATT